MGFTFLESMGNEHDIKLMNPLVWAFVGDAVFETAVRCFLSNKCKDMSVHHLHVKAITYVKAHAQSEAAKRLEDIFEEEEKEIFRRGRNAKSGTVPKNADVQEYRAATGLEAVIGYLYLMNRNERLEEILRTIILEDSHELES